MAVYKVPQDVEAEDKLVGPFGFRQFVYLLIGGGAGGLTFLLFKAPIPVPFFSVLTIPIMVLMAILALPLKKDQPMEIYLAAIVRFMLKPKRRLWMNDGTAAGVIIDPPRAVKLAHGKGITQDEALGQLSYLSRIVDTRGWAAKGVDIPQETSVNTAVASALADTEDIMDENTGLAKSFDSLIAKQKQTSRQAAMQRMHELGGAAVSQQGGSQQPSRNPQPLGPAPQSTAQIAPKAPAPKAELMDEARPHDPWKGAGADDQKVASRPHFNPYPNMHQQILTPIDRLRANTFHAPAAGAGTPQQGGDIQVQSAAAMVPPAAGPQAATEQTTANKDMTPAVSPDIMRLANNNDLSIQAIANEAHRLSGEDAGEVVVKLH